MMQATARSPRSGDLAGIGTMAIVMLNHRYAVSSCFAYQGPWVEATHGYFESPLCGGIDQSNKLIGR